MKIDCLYAPAISMPEHIVSADESGYAQEWCTTSPSRLRTPA